MTTGERCRCSICNNLYQLLADMAALAEGSATLAALDDEEDE